MAPMRVHLALALTSVLSACGGGAGASSFGGVTQPGVLEHCWQQLKPGGRLLANAVTLQSEARLLAWRAEHGGELIRIQVAQAQPLGDFDTWRSALPITLLELHKPC